MVNIGQFDSSYSDCALNLYIIHHTFFIVRGCSHVVKLPRLSIIIPAYNEEKRLPNTLVKVLSFLQSPDLPLDSLDLEALAVLITFSIRVSGLDDARLHLGAERGLRVRVVL